MIVKFSWLEEARDSEVEITKKAVGIRENVPLLHTY